MPRRTKILATLGPATDSKEVLTQLVQAGVNVVRLNFSHGVAEDHIRRANLVREVAKEQGVYVGILGDLQGPKIRVSTFVDKKVELVLAQTFTLDAAMGPGEGTDKSVGIDYKELPQDVTQGDRLLLDDGRIQLEVTSVEGDKVHTKVVVAGPLSNNKGINREGGGLSAAALTDKDKADILTAAKIGTDYLAVSFPRNGADINYARELATQAGLKTRLVAKIERAEAVESDEALDDIIAASDAVMVARGDLGVEIGDAALVAQQKKIINHSRTLNKIVITATQMMESMITNPMPTRAEVMDVANAVIDGTDAVMLSAETAAGDYPVETVEAMARVCIGAEQHPRTFTSKHRVDMTFDEVSEITALTAMYAANHLSGVKAIVALTESGYTPRIMSRISSGLPIYGLSLHESTLNRMALFRGVYPVSFDYTQSAPGHISRDALKDLKQKGLLQSGDQVIISYGDRMGTVGSTNTCKILTVE